MANGREERENNNDNSKRKLCKCCGRNSEQGKWVGLGLGFSDVRLSVGETFERAPFPLVEATWHRHQHLHRSCTVVNQFSYANVITNESHCKFSEMFTT